MYYVVIFFSRRYMMVLIITLLQTFRNVQIFSYLWITLFMLCYIASIRPYKELRNNLQEIINEVTILVAGYSLLTFTEWVDDHSTRLVNGWFLVGCIIFSLVFNITLLSVVGCKELYHKLRRLYYSYLRKKSLLKSKLKKDATQLVGIDGPSEAANILAPIMAQNSPIDGSLMISVKNKTA